MTQPMPPNSFRQDQPGDFRSLVCFNSGNAELATSLAFFPSMNEGQLDAKLLRTLHQEEIRTGEKYASVIRKRSYLHGRIAGKMAIKQVFPEIPSAGILITTGSSGEPVCELLNRPYGVSIAHSEVWNAGLCFPLLFSMGVDVESLDEKNRHIMTSVMSDREKEQCWLSGNELECLHVLWTAKEAAAKAVRLGFRVPLEWYEIEEIETVTNGDGMIRRCRFRHFSMFTTFSVAIPQAILSIAFPADKNLDHAMISLLGMKSAR